MGAERHEVGLIGAGIGASLSPALHEREARRAGAGLRVPADRHRRARPARRRRRRCSSRRASAGFSGLNVTHPCKQAVVPHLDALSDDAAALAGRQHGRVRRRPRDRPQHRHHRLRRELRARPAGRARSSSVVLLGAGGAGHRGRLRGAAARRRAADDRRRRRRARARVRRASSSSDRACAGHARRPRATPTG